VDRVRRVERVSQLDDLGSPDPATAGEREQDECDGSEDGEGEATRHHGWGSF
jgi:hypothetical protein